MPRFFSALLALCLSALVQAETYELRNGDLIRRFELKDGRFRTLGWTDKATGRTLDVDSDEFAIRLSDGTVLTADDYEAKVNFRPPTKEQSDSHHNPGYLGQVDFTLRPKKTTSPLAPPLILAMFYSDLGILPKKPRSVPADTILKAVEISWPECKPDHKVTVEVERFRTKAKGGRGGRGLWGDGDRRCCWLGRLFGDRRRNRDRSRRFVLKGNGIDVPDQSGRQNGPGRRLDGLHGFRFQTHPVFEPVQKLDQRTVIALHGRTVRLNLAQHGAHNVHSGEQCPGDLGVDDERAVPHFAEQILGGMRHRLELGITQKAGGPLQRVDRPEYAAQGLLVMRILFQLNQVPLEAVQVFMAFNQKLFNEVVHMKCAGR